MIIRFTRFQDGEDVLVRELGWDLHQFEHRQDLAVQERKTGKPEEMERLYVNWVGRLKERAIR